MTSVPIRDPLADDLITPQNAALIVIDYQQNQFTSVRSMDSGLQLERRLNGEAGAAVRPLRSDSCTRATATPPGCQVAGSSSRYLGPHSRSRREHSSAR